MALRFTLRQLEYLVAVGETGSVALAAEKVAVSSPSVSTAISQLEAELGVQLFVRKHAQGLSLTPAGRQIVAQAQRVLAEARAVGRMAVELTGTVRGPLAVGCLLTFAQIVVPHLRRVFQTRHPDVRVSQTEQHQSELFAMLRRADIDLALTYDLDIPADLTFTPLAVLPPYALLPVSHPLSGHQSVTVAELAEEPFVLLDLPLSADYFLTFFRDAGVAPRIAERTRDMAVMRSLVANGFGYSIANIRPVTDQAPDGRRLRFVPLSGNLRPLRLGVVTAEGAVQLPVIRAFLELCREQISDASVPGLNMDGS